MTLFILLLTLLQQPSLRVEGILVDGTNGAHSDGPFLFEFSKSGGTVEGRVVGSAGKPVADASVIFVPSADLRADDFSHKVASAADQGRFIIKGIRPDNYTVFAISEKLGRSIHLTPYLNYGMHIEVGKEQHISQNLTLIPRQ